MPLMDIRRDQGIHNVDFLTMDVEGHEPTILKSMDFAAYPVPLIAIEIQGSFDTALSSETHHLLTAAGYLLYARTGPTMFYERNASAAVCIDPAPVAGERRDFTAATREPSRQSQRT